MKTRRYRAYCHTYPIFEECGFDINKATAHGLLSKAYVLLQVLERVIRGAALEDDYINMDESFFTALEVGPRAVDHTQSSKVYIWCAQARHKNLVCFFYDQGSRAAKVLTDYVPHTYKGAIQSDGLSNYKILQGRIGEDRANEWKRGYPNIEKSIAGQVQEIETDGIAETLTENETG